MNRVTRPPTRRAFGASIGRGMLAATVSPVAAALPTPAPSASRALINHAGRLYALAFLPEGCDPSGTGEDIPAIEGPAGTFRFGLIDDERIPDPPIPGPDHPRPAEILPPLFPGDAHRRMPTVVRQWAPGDAERCRLCSYGCVAKPDPETRGATCVVYLPGSLASAPSAELGLFTTKSPLYYAGRP